MHAQCPSPSREALRGRMAPWWALACKHSEATHRLPLRRVHEHMALRRPFGESLVHSRLVRIVVGRAIEGHKDALGEIPDEAGSSRHSEAITSQHQRSSLAIISGHQPTRAGRQPRGHHQRSSVVQSMVISLLGRVDSPEVIISDHQWCNQWSSAYSGGSTAQRSSSAVISGAINGHQPTRAGRQPRGHHQRSSVVQSMVISLLGRVDSPEVIISGHQLCNQWSSAYSGGSTAQRSSSAVISGAINGHQPTRAGRQPRGHHQRSSVVQSVVISLLGRVDSPEVIISGHQWCNQWSSAYSGGSTAQRSSSAIISGAINGHQPTRAGRQPRAPPL